MSKPVGFYANYTPFDGSLIDQMVGHFGDQFQKMTPTEKCWLLYRIGYHLWFHDAEAEGVRDEVEVAMQHIESDLSAGEKLALMDAIVNQLKVQLRHML